MRHLVIALAVLAASPGPAQAVERQMSRHAALRDGE